MVDRELHKAIHHLLWVWKQYACGTEVDGFLVLPHQCMRAGEGASDFLERHGLGVDRGWDFMLNEAGMEILNDETLGD